MGSTTYSETYAYNTDGSVYTVTPSSGGTYAFEYDALKRQSSRYNWYYKTSYSYAAGKNSGETTTQVSGIDYTARPGGTSFSAFGVDYTYDALGNITSITSTEWPDLNATYKYDAQGQLIEETNRNNTFYYTYDTYGNIRTAQKADSTSSTVFSYDDTEWRDLLTAYKGHAINYDAIGNPLNWKNNTTWTSLTWQNGRQLASIASSAKSLSFTYDLAGIRDSKTVVASGVTTTYNFVTQNGQVVRQTWTDGTTSHVMDFLYDNQGKPYAADYDGTRYYYVLSLQGDVLRMVDTTGATVASYVYDAWGRVLTSSGTLKDVNPLRYRGYYYDSETKLYYLGSRYYDPLVKRFINSDTSNLVIANPNSLNDKNLFAYCDNNPVMRTDDGGEFWNVVVGAAVGGIINGACTLYSCVKSGESGWSLAGQVATSFVCGAIGGAVAGTTLGVVGQTVVGGVLGAVESLANQAISGNGVSLKEVASSTLCGAIGATIGGNGAAYDSVHVLTQKRYARNSLQKLSGNLRTKISKSIPIIKKYGAQVSRYAYKRLIKSTCFSIGIAFLGNKVCKAMCS